MNDENRVLLIGATGHLGAQVARQALGLGLGVRALVREGSDAPRPQRLGVEVVRGDLLDRDSLKRALKGCRAVIHTAIGYSNRRKGDSGSGVDITGNENLAAAIKESEARRLVFCSVLTCDAAQSVPHFWNKWLSEQHFEQAGVPFVALRPGAFLDQADDFWVGGLKKGKLPFLIPDTTPLTFVHSSDVARYLARAVDIETSSKNLRIDIGTDRPVSTREIAQVMSNRLGRRIKTQTPPWPLISTGLAIAGLFDPWQRDLKQMMAYFRNGTYVADTSKQRQIFGEVPTIEASIEKYLHGAGLLEQHAAAAQ